MNKHKYTHQILTMTFKTTYNSQGFTDSFLTVSFVESRSGRVLTSFRPGEDGIKIVYAVTHKPYNVYLECCICDIR